MEPDFLTKLFDQFDTPESYIILVIMLVAFLFGLLVGILSRGSRIRQLQEMIDKYQKQFKDQEAQIIALKARTDTLEENLALKTGELQSLLNERDEARGKAQMLEDEMARLYSDISGINTELEKMEVSNQSYLSAIENLENQIIGLKAKNEQLTRQQEMAAPPSFPTGEIFPPADLPETTTGGFPPAGRIEAVERKLQRLEDENTALKYELQVLKEHAVPGDDQTGALDIPFIGGVEEAPPEPELEFDLMAEEHPQPATGEESAGKDDLTLIKGIGPFIEKKLNDIGIHTFLQVSRLNAGDIKQITHDIQFFEGRIEKDDWMGQAARLHRLKTDDPETFRKLTGHPSDPGDLQIIEGIGPKIEMLFKNAGIENWEDLAQMTSERLRQILDEAGEQYRIHDPSTWPAQAQLAVNGNWELLREYQDQLKGGREEKDEDL